jgi:hypothetical protein
LNPPRFGFDQICPSLLGNTQATNALDLGVFPRNFGTRNAADGKT